MKKTGELDGNLEKMSNFALSNWKRAPLCERITLLLSCEGVAFVTRLHSVANFCNKKLRVLGSERMLKRLRLGLKGNTVGIRSSTRYCVVIVRRNSHCGDMPLSDPLSPPA